MKFVVIGIGLFFWVQFSLGQAQENPVTSAQVEEAVKAIVKDEYIRIPKSDFDALIVQQVSEKVNEKFNNLYYIIGAAIGLLTTFSFIQTNRSRTTFEKIIDAKASIAKQEIVEEIETQYDRVVGPRVSEIERGLKREMETVSTEIEANLKQVQKQVDKGEKQMKKTNEYMINGEVQILRKIARDMTYESSDINRTLRVLKDIEKSDNLKDKIPQTVNILSLMYYDQRSYNELNDLISKYENDYTLHANTYINGALTAISDYHSFASVNQREKALEYLDKSLKQTQGYGEALALKVEIFMMDYIRAITEEERNTAHDNAFKVINDILNSASNAPAYEAIRRFASDFKSVYYRKFLDQMYINFKDLVLAMLLRANTQAADKYLEGYHISQITSLVPPPEPRKDQLN
ncbi:MAG: hypothetical protein AAFP76_07070 [Bacteroidota bacterium]